MGGQTLAMTTTRYEVNDGVATLTLDRPERLNAIAGTMMAEVAEHLTTATEDDAVRAFVLTGAGRAFCAGGDLAGLTGGGTGGSAGGSAGGSNVGATRAHLRIAELLHHMPKLTIAAVNGAAAGAGMSWACACDVRFAAEEAFFTTAFLAAGQTGDYGLTWTLPRIIGAGRARELFLLGGRVPAPEALRIGLVNRVLPASELLAVAHEAARGAAASAPLTLAALKANIDDGERLSLGVLLDAEAERFAANMATEDAGEAARAFLEKRPPVFRGR